MEQVCYDIFNALDLPFETYITENMNHSNSIHEELEIIWLMKGQATIYTNNRAYVMKAHHVFLVYMYREHSIHSEPGSLIVSYRLKKTYLHKNNLFFEKVIFKERMYTFDQLALKYKQVPLLVVQMMKLLVNNEADEAIKYKIIAYYNMYVNGLYRELIKDQSLDVKHVDYDDYLNRIHMIVEYTYHHFKDKITLKDLSSLVSRSHSRLSHFIKDALGISYREFLMNVRFEHALKLLKETRLSISEVVKRSGFSDHKYLSQLMKKRFNLTPLNYRRKENYQFPCIQLSIGAEKLCQELKVCIERLDKDEQFKHLVGMDIALREI